MNLFQGSNKSSVVQTAAIVGASAAAAAYLNHKLGAGEMKLFAKTDGTGGVPVDGTVALLGIGYAFLRPSAKFAPLALGIGIGNLAGFGYRAGAAAGDKAAVTAATAPKAISTSGNVPSLAGHYGGFAHSQNRSAMGHAVSNMRAG